MPRSGTAGRGSDETMGELPEPQRRALEVALLRREPEGQPLQRAVALGTLGVLAALAREHPIVVGIDDVQWLDHESESVLAFVARRLKDERIGLLVTRRLEGSSTLPLDLERAFVDGRLGHLRVGSLGPVELDRLLVARLDARLSGAVARPRSRSIRREPVLRARDRQGDEHATICRQPTTTSRSRRACTSSCATGLAPATDLPARRRRSLQRCRGRHGRSIDAVTGSGDSALRSRRRHGRHRRARRRPRAVRAPAARLDHVRADPARSEARPARAPGRDPRGSGGTRASSRPGGRRPRPRGRCGARRGRPAGTSSRAPASAAELWEQARRLTPADAEREARRRGVEAAERRFDAGEVDRARALLEEVVAESPPGGSGHGR